MTKNIEKTLTFLQTTFDESSYLPNNQSEKKYRLEHTMRTANIAKTLAEAEGLHVEGLVIALLLHDVSYALEFQSQADWKNHGRTSAAMAKTFVNSLDLPTEVKQDILYGIAIHVDDEADFEGTKNTFALSVSDADNIDRFDVYRLYDLLKSNQIETLSISDQLAFVEQQLSRLKRVSYVHCSTKKAKELFDDHVNFSIEFLMRYQSQIQKSMNIVVEDL